MQAINLLGWIIQGNNLINGAKNKLRPKSTNFNGVLEISANVVLTDADVLYVKGKAKKGVSNRMSLTYSLEFIDHVPQDGQLQCHELKTDHQVSRLIELAPEILYFEDFNYEIPSKIKVNYAESEEKDRVAEEEYWIDVLNDVYLYDGLAANDLRFDIVDWLVTNPGDDDAIKNRVNKINDTLRATVTESWENLPDGVKKPFNFKHIVVDHIRYSSHVEFFFEIKADPLDQRKHSHYLKEAKGPNGSLHSYYLLKPESIEVKMFCFCLMSLQIIFMQPRKSIF